MCLLIGMGRNRILSLPAPGVAAPEAFQPQPAPAQRPMAFHSFEEILRAGGMKATAAGGSTEQGKQRRKRPLIGANEETNEQNHRQGRRIGACRARRNRALISSSALTLLLVLDPVACAKNASRSRTRHSPGLGPSTFSTPPPTARRSPRPPPDARSRPAKGPARARIDGAARSLAASAARDCARRHTPLGARLRIRPGRPFLLPGARSRA